MLNDVISWVRLLPAAGCVGIGTGAAVVWHRRARTRWTTLAVGAAVWLGSVASKVGWALPTNDLVRRHLPAPAYWIYIGLLTGVFEVGATLAVVRATRLRRADHREALTFGVGFGAIEAVLVGLAGLVRTGPVTLVTAVAPPLERATALVFHVVTCALVVHGFRVGRPWRWFALAFGYKSAVDAVATWALLAGGVGHDDAKLAAFELSLAAFAIASVWALGSILGRTSPLPLPAVPEST